MVAGVSDTNEIRNANIMIDYAKAPMLSDRTFPAMDFYIAECNELIRAVERGGWVEASNGQHVSGLMAVTRIKEGRISPRYFEEGRPTKLPTLATAAATH